MAARAAGSVRDGGVGMLALGSPLWVAGICCLLSAAGEAEVSLSLPLSLSGNPFYIPVCQQRQSQVMNGCQSPLVI